MFEPMQPDVYQHLKVEKLSYTTSINHRIILKNNQQKMFFRFSQCTAVKI